MKKALASLAFLLLSLRSLAAPSLTELVDDQAAFFMRAADVPQIRKNIESGPLGRTWRDPKVQKYFAPLLASAKWEEADAQFFKRTGLHIADAADRFRGEVLVTARFKPGIIVQPEAPMTFLFLADLKGDEKEIAGLIATLNEPAKKSDDASSAEEGAEDEAFKDVDEVETVAGAVVHSVVRIGSSGGEKTRSVQCAWSYHKGIFALSNTAADVSAFAVAQEAGGLPNALSKSDLYLELQKRVPDLDLEVVLNFNVIVPKGKAYALKATEGRPANPFVDVGDIFRASGAEQLSSAWFGSKATAAQDESYSGLTYSEARGLVRMLALHDGPPPRPDFASEKWLSVTALKCSVPDAYDAIQAALKDYNPGLEAIASAYVTAYNKKIGLDLRRDLIGALGDEFVMATAYRPGVDVNTSGLGDLDKIFAFSLSNPKAFLAALDKYEQMVDPAKSGLIAKRDFMDASIHSIIAGQDAMHRPLLVTYAVVNNEFLLSVGSPGPLESAIRTWKNHEKTFWDKPDVKRALNELPSEAVAFSSQDSRAIVALVFSTLNRLQELSERTSKNGATPVIDPNSKPTVEDLSKYWGSTYSWIWRDAHGIYTKAIQPRKP